MLSKGLKRKREEEETMEALSVDSCWLDPSHPAVAQTPPTVASSSLFDLSVVKLHHSLRQSEPDLRHLVLVVNTLRRIQASMEPAPVLPPEPIQPQPLLWQTAFWLAQMLASQPPWPASWKISTTLRT